MFTLMCILFLSIIRILRVALKEYCVVVTMVTVVTVYILVYRKASNIKHFELCPGVTTI